MRAVRLIPCVVLLCCLALASASCSGASSSSPTSPSPTPAPSPSATPSPSPSPTPTPTTPAFPAGTVLRVISGETDQPVPGARVVVGSESYETDAAGQVTLRVGVSSEVSLDVVAVGYFDRQTRLSQQSGSQFTLWPKTSPTGISEHLTAELVYSQRSGTNPGNVGSIGTESLSRVAPGINRIGITATTAPLAASGVAAIQAAVDALNRGMAGRVVFLAGAPGDANFQVAVDPARLPAGSSGGAFPTRNSAGYITGGAIILREGDCITTECNINEPRSYGVTIVRTLVHEVGHLIGLGHTSARSVMNGGCTTPGGCGGVIVDPRGVEFSAAERLILRMIMQRPIGNRFPDTDR